MLESELQISRAYTRHGMAIQLGTRFRPRDFSHYLRYLQGKQFTMSDPVEAIFLYMGHDRGIKARGLWKAELQDAWVRDNFYRLKLWSRPYFGLCQMKRVYKGNYWSRDLPVELCSIGFDLLSDDYEILVDKDTYGNILSILNPVRSVIGTPPSGVYKCDDHMFLYGPDEDINCWRKTWKSANEIAFFHPMSHGLISVDRSNIIAMTHTTHYRLQRDAYKLYCEAYHLFENEIPLIDPDLIMDPDYPCSYGLSNDKALAVNYHKKFLSRYYEWPIDASYGHEYKFISFD